MRHLRRRRRRTRPGRSSPTTSGHVLRRRHRRHDGRGRRRPDRRGHGRQGRQGRGPARHRLQVRRRHPGARAVDPQRRRSRTRSSRSATRSRRSSSRRRTRKAGSSCPRSGRSTSGRGARSRRSRKTTASSRARSSRSSRAASSSTSACAASCPPRSSSCAGCATCSPTSAATLEAKIIELDKNRNNVVLSRRAWLEETQKEQREDFLANLKPGEVRKGVVSTRRQLRCLRRPRRHGRPHPRVRAVVEARRPPRFGRAGRRRGHGAGARGRPRPRAHQPVAQGHAAGPVAGVRHHPPGRRARLRPGHQARAVRRVRPGRRRHRGPRAHLGDVGPPRRPARAGRHPRRGAVGQDHRPRPRSAAASACRSSRPPRAARWPRSTASTSASTPTTTRATTSASADDAEREAAWAEYYEQYPDGAPEGDADARRVGVGAEPDAGPPACLEAVSRHATGEHVHRAVPGTDPGTTSARRRRCYAQFDDAHAHGREHGLGAVAGVELLVDRRQVVLHRLLADVELLGHLGGRAAVGDELQHLFLALGDDPVLLVVAGWSSLRTSSSIDAASWGDRAVSPLAAMRTASAISSVEQSFTR